MYQYDQFYMSFEIILIVEVSLQEGGWEYP